VHLAFVADDERAAPMPIYALGDLTPELPAPGRYWVAPDAQVIGRVRIGDEVGIWFGAVLRSETEWIEIGARSNVQDGAVCHTDPGCPVLVGEGCTVGHRAILHGCVVGPNTLIGMGATVLNRARIGANCLVGANALITEGREFPDNALILGSPAKVVRMLDENAIAGLRLSAEAYVARWRTYDTALKVIAG
jgi:carbonic anhydrase/acetyltransferase-like protein (isoleucine patch superfamily)